eukprot:356456-Chlamydomonas_euryale.AAC.2
MQAGSSMLGGKLRHLARRLAGAGRRAWAGCSHHHVLKVWGSRVNSRGETKEEGDEEKEASSASRSFPRCPLVTPDFRAFSNPGPRWIRRTATATRDCAAAKHGMPAAVPRSCQPPLSRADGRPNAPPAPTTIQTSQLPPAFLFKEPQPPRRWRSIFLAAACSAQSSTPPRPAGCRETLPRGASSGGERACGRALALSTCAAPLCGSLSKGGAARVTQTPRSRGRVLAVESSPCAHLKSNQRAGGRVQSADMRRHASVKGGAHGACRDGGSREEAAAGGGVGKGGNC